MLAVHPHRLRVPQDIASDMEAESENVSCYAPGSKTRCLPKTCRKAALQRELDHLRQQLSQGRADASPVHEEPQTALAGLWQGPADIHLNPVPSLQTTPTSQDHAYPAFPRPNSSSLEGEQPFSSMSLSLEGHIRSRRPSTMSRRLGGREYDTQRIDDCFDL